MPPAGMVHALAEVWRILRPGGHLIDLRPIASESPVEVVTGAGTSLAGWLDTTPKVPSDKASDKAIIEAIKHGWFTEESATTFQYAYYWETVKEMHTFLEENWNSAVLPDSVQTEADRLAYRLPGPVQIRVQRTMHLARYRKLTVARYAVLITMPYVAFLNDELRAIL